jgi:glutamate/tyrosine decarboxylase-like PLP-dependent enzyme
VGSERRLYVLSPLVSVVEEITAGWLKDLAGLPAAWSTGFVTGCQAANFTALATARHHLLAQAGWDVEATRPVRRAAELHVVCSDESHYTIFNALKLLGLGAERVTRVATDDRGACAPRARQRARRARTARLLVCAQAGNVNTGAFDPIDEIATLDTSARGAWLHVDGAFGLWAAASPARAHLVRGIARADSVATDAHKWLNVPYDSGVVFTAHPAAHRRAMTLGAAYIVESDGSAIRTSSCPRNRAAAGPSRSTRRSGRWGARASPAWSSAAATLATAWPIACAPTTGSRS